MGLFPSIESIAIPLFFGIIKNEHGLQSEEIYGDSFVHVYFE